MRCFSLKVQCLLLGMLWLNFAAYSQETFVASYKGETAITYKPGNPSIIVGGSNDYSSPSVTRVVSHRTINGGYISTDWLTTTLPLPTGKTNAADPTADYDANGNVYYCFTAFERENGNPVRGGIYLCKSTNNGQTWGNPMLVDIPEFTDWHNDKPWMIVDRSRTPNRIYVAWTQIRSDGVADLLFAYSQDGGVSFTQRTIQLENTGTSQFKPYNQGVAMALGLGANAPLYVAWAHDSVKTGPSYVSNATVIFAAKSTDGGSSFPNRYIVKSGFNTASRRGPFGSFRFNSFPSIVVSPTTGYIHTSWCEKEGEVGGSPGTLKIHFKRSLDGAQTWLNEDTVSSPITDFEQWSPFLSVNTSGRIFLTFYNFKVNPGLDPPPHPSRLYSQTSTDNGVSFGESYPHATVDSNPVWGINVTDYIGAIAPPDNPLPTTLWMDFRNGTPTAQRGDTYFDQKLHLASNVSTATAGNGQRKLAKGQNANEYHLIYEANGEIWYTNTTDGGTTWSPEKLLSERSGMNSSPCIAERSGKIYVAWQKLNGSSYDVYFHMSTDGGSTWPDANRQTRATSVGTSAPLPVITSPTTNEAMLVYRNGGNLAWQRSTNNGSTWPTTGTIPGTALNSPSVAPAKTPWGTNTTALAYATNLIPNASNVLIHYYNSNWGSGYNLCSNLPGNLSQHANPSIAASGDLTNTSPHTAWDAYDSQYASRVILHKHGWGSSTYHELHYQTEDRPSITGLTGTTAEMVFRRGSDYVLTSHFDGSYWNINFPALAGNYPAFSLGNTQAKYVTTNGSAAPYEVKLSATTFSKAALLAENTGSGNNYHRAVGLVNTATGGWLNVRIENYLVKHTDGSFSVADFSAAPLDTAVLSSTIAWAALASTPFTLPADAESLIVVLSVAGDKVASLSNSQNPLTLQFKAQTAAGQTVIKDFPAATFVSNQPFNQSNLRISMNTAGFSSGTLLRFAANLDNQKTGTPVVASLGHIYEYVDNANNASLNRLANQAPSLPADFVLEQNFPNPFNPETQIRYSIPQPADVTLRIYTISGQVVATLVEGEQTAGTHIVTWNGLNRAGARVSSGIYFYKLETKDFTQVRKLLLAK